MQSRGKGRFCSSECSNPNINKRIECQCILCESTFHVTPYKKSKGGGKYCSPECYHQSKRKQIECKCQNCGILFYVTPSMMEEGRGKHCSQTCLFRSRSNKKEEELIEKKCGICGKAFKVQKCKSKRKYCSKKCGGIPKVTQIKKICIKCSRPYSIKGSKAADSKYCSMKCRESKVERNCKECNKVFFVQTNVVRNGGGHFCSWECTKSCKSSSLEIMIEEEIKKIGFPYQKEKRFWRYKADFFIPHLDLIVECDGTQHEKPKYKRRDKIRDKWFSSNGYRTIRLKDKEIRKNPREALINKLPSLQASLF